MDGADPHDLERFVAAQRGAYDDALAELRAGRKRSHWMWFVFPQVRGLGSSPTARRYAIGSLAEARAFLAHPVLGPRLEACAQALLALPDGTAASTVFGFPDDLKLRSSMTLFAALAGPDCAFAAVLARYAPEGPDPRTLEVLAGWGFRDAPA